MTPLESRLILQPFICKQFGFTNLRAMLELMAMNIATDDAKSWYVDMGMSSYAEALRPRLKNRPSTVTPQQLEEYDRNIIALSQQLGMTVEQQRTWKPFQYLALLFTERYLHLYFTLSAEVFCGQLNAERRLNRAMAADELAYTPSDLRKLAFQSATGSGKTLLLHANILQYQHYLRTSGQRHRFNKIILVTPDEGLSNQHLRELEASGIPARLFSDQDADIFSRGGSMVDIIDLNKLSDKKGVKRVAMAAFEDNNLVLVDEGHLGTSGRVWRGRREQLAENGFTFEYSATFNQAVAGSGASEFRDAYAKSILFDYSYRHFYADGYGKDYKICNLPNSDDGHATDLYLLACLLTFYQQCRIYADSQGGGQGGGQAERQADWAPFNLAPPLWVFLGRTVTGRVGQAMQTDIVRIVGFLGQVLAVPAATVAGIAQLFSDSTGLLDQQGRALFADAFDEIKPRGAKAVYADICRLVCHAAGGAGRLHIQYLPSGDELQLRAGDNPVFGAINVGDAAGLYNLLAAQVDAGAGYSVSKESGFAPRLFAEVDQPHSPLNVVIGARRFAAGWNSWRVSTMGLLHVGTGEGAQIIQMFGRGVRLKGFGMSLKRHTALNLQPSGSEQLKLLETLNIFGLRANYMNQFREYLQAEGLVEEVLFELPVTKNLGKVKGLKVLKLPEDVDWVTTETCFTLPLPGKAEVGIAELDLYPRVETLDAEDAAAQPAIEPCKLEKGHLAFINRQRVYHGLIERQQANRWHNLDFTRDKVDELLETDFWYTLKIPPEKLAFDDFARVEEWEQLVIELVAKYAEATWKRARRNWESKQMQVVELNDTDANFIDSYTISVDAKNDALIADVKELIDTCENRKYFEQCRLGVLLETFQGYQPLLFSYSDEKVVTVRPVALNKNEADFVKKLAKLLDNRPAELAGFEVYLMRNLSRGRGVSLFNDYEFYPDFILWLKTAQVQHIAFVDPKGLGRLPTRTTRKMQMHTKIKDVQAQLHASQPNQSNLFLHSYIWSVTPYSDVANPTDLTPQEFVDRGVYWQEERAEGLGRLLQSIVAVH